MADIDPVVLNDLLRADTLHLLSESGKACVMQGLPPTEECSVLDAAIVQINNSLTKKFVDGAIDTADSAALDLFLKNLEKVSSWELQLHDDFDRVLWGELKRSFYDFFHPQGGCFIEHLEEMLSLARVGPGSSIGSSGTDFYTKLFSSTLTCSSPFVASLWDRYIEKFPDLVDAEIIRTTHFGNPDCTCNFGKLNFAPKKRSISRTIITPPSLNIFFQLSLGELLVRRIKDYFGFDLAGQDIRNRKLAWAGSILCFFNSDNPYCTIDLTLASDSFSKKLFDILVPESARWIFNELREPFVKLPDGSIRELPFYLQWEMVLPFPFRQCCSRVSFKPPTVP